MIENFAALSEKEQRDFAEAFIKTINSEKIFADFELKIASIEADDFTGDLEFNFAPVVVELTRRATWTCDDEEDAYFTPEDPDFVDGDWDDAKKALKTLSTEIEGYSVELDIADMDVGKIIAIDEVKDIRADDDGIGSYEFWGETGYDSRPYYEVEGTITQEFTLYLGMFVGVAAPTVENTEEE